MADTVKIGIRLTGVGVIGAKRTSAEVTCTTKTGAKRTRAEAIGAKRIGVGATATGRTVRASVTHIAKTAQGARTGARTGRFTWKGAAEGATIRGTHDRTACKPLTHAMLCCPAKCGPRPLQSNSTC